MEKTFLEKQIENRAKERFDKDYESFLKFGLENKIARMLTLKPEEGKNGLPIFNSSSNRGLFNGYQELNHEAGKTNYEKVKQEVIEKYIKEETDMLLKKMDDLQYFFNMAMNNQ